MRQVDDVVRKVLNLQPTTTTTTPKIQCTLFEDYAPTRIYSGWCFTPPLAVKTSVDVDLHRLLKHVEIDQHSKSLLGKFASEVNRCRARVYREGANEEDWLCYVNFLGVLSLLFENNTATYKYCLPSTEKDVIASDKFFFEYTQALIGLLAYYDNSGDNYTRSGTLCSAILCEIRARCVEYSSGSTKLVYVEPPRSLTGGGTVMVALDEEAATPQLAMETYINELLGGESAIEARIHLCTAKENEALYATTGECVYMSATHRAYKQASLHCAGDKPLYRHVLFMGHLWFCRAHFFIAKRDAAGLLEVLLAQTESDEQLERATVVLARLLLITKEARMMEEKERYIIENLSTELEDSYNTLIDELTVLTTQFDTELYVKRKIKEKEGVKLALPILPSASGLATKPNMLADVRQAARKRYMEQHPDVAEAQQLLRALHGKLKNHRAGMPLVLQPSGDTAVVVPRIEAMDRATKLGIFEERQGWLESLLSMYSIVDHAFVINSDYHTIFVKELQEVKDAKAQIIKS